MAKARTLDKRRKSIRNIRKITRTMELIATARFKKAMDRAVAASEYTKRITRLAADLARSGIDVSHPLLESREQTSVAVLLVLTANRGLCGGYNGAVIRTALSCRRQLAAEVESLHLEVSGKRGIAAMKFRKIAMDETFTHFEDRPRFDEVVVLANRYLEEYAARRIDRLDVVYTRFLSSSKQTAVSETLLPLGSLGDADEDESKKSPQEAPAIAQWNCEFLPSAASILEEVAPASFRVKLFKCFLDAAVSEQIARMVAMKSATENADEMIRQLSMTYNRARQTQITSELLEVMGGAEALKG